MFPFPHKQPIYNSRNHCTVKQTDFGNRKEVWLVYILVYYLLIIIYLSRETELEKDACNIKDSFKTVGINIKKVLYAGDPILIAENTNELQVQIIIVKDHSNETKIQFKGD